MSSTTLYTASDAINYLLDFQGAAADAITLRKIKSAILAAYRDVPNIRAWNYYLQRLRFTTVASYSTGTVTYTNSTRTLTLASGTWPTWAAFGVVLISSVPYQVASRSSSSEIILSVNSNPGADLAAGTSYSIYRDTYPAPVDVKEIGQLQDLSTCAWLSYVTAEEWLGTFRTWSTPQRPRVYCIRQDPHYLGSLGISVSPPPDAAYNFDGMYRRYPRQLQTMQYTTGTVTTSGTTVTGTGTAFTSLMAGSVIRFGSTTDAPTGISGATPFVGQRIISSYTSATSLTLDQALDSEVTSVKYEISDPIDLNSGPMYSAFLANLMWQLALQTRAPDANTHFMNYQRSIQLAAEADSASYADKPSRGPIFYPLRNMPFTLNTS